MGTPATPPLSINMFKTVCVLLVLATISGAIHLRARRQESQGVVSLAMCGNGNKRHCTCSDGVRLTWRRIHVVMAPIWTREPVNVPRVTLRKLAPGRVTPFTQSAWAQTETQSDPPVGAVTTPWQTGLTIPVVLDPPGWSPAPARRSNT